MNPDFFSRERCFYHAATIDIAMIKKLGPSFAPQFQPVCSSTKALAEGSNEPASLIENDDRLAAHARLVDRVADIDVPLLILAKPVCIAPYESLGRHKPIMDTFVSVQPGTHHWKPSARLVGGLSIEP